MTPEQFKQEILALLPDFSGEVTPRSNSVVAYLSVFPQIRVTAYDTSDIDCRYSINVGDAKFYRSCATLTDCLNAYVSSQMEDRLATIRKIRDLELTLMHPAIPEELAPLVPKWRYAPAIEQFRTNLGTADAEYWDTESAITSVRFCAHVDALRYTFDAVSGEWWCETLDGSQSVRGESPRAAKAQLLSNLEARALSHAGERARAEETLKRVEREEALLATLRAPQGGSK